MEVKTKLFELSNEYFALSCDRDQFLWRSIHYQTVKASKMHDEIYIYITKPDKGSGVVILNKKDYLDKMQVILSDSAKFKRIGPFDSCDNTMKVEAKTQRWLLSLYKSHFISKDVYNRVRPVGSQRPRM